MKNSAHTNPTHFPATAQLGTWLVAIIGLAFLVGPVFTHADLSLEHIAAHLVTGPVMIGLAAFQLIRIRKELEPSRGVNWMLAALGAWLIALPFAVPAEGLHIHGHAISGLVVASAAVWSAMRAAAPSSLAGQIQ